MKIKNVFYFLLSMCILSCSKKAKIETEEQYYKIFELENDGWKSKAINNYIGNINYTATEVPIQYYILKNNQNRSLNYIDSIYQENKMERVVEFEFRHNEEKDLLGQKFTKRDYTEGVKYLSFLLSNDFMLITSSNDTIQCSGVNFERNFKVAPFKRTLLYFEGIKPEDNVKLVYQDNLFGNGILKFNFKETPIKL